MALDLIEQGYIPLDKSWIIRMGVLDLVRGYDDTIDFLRGQTDFDLSGDLKALYRASLDWRKGEAVDVGESGTLYRFLRYAAWKSDLNKKFVRRGTLWQREISDNREIINYSLEDLLKLDNGTSQWASAAVLLGHQETVADPPYKLKLTYEAVAHWNEQRQKGQGWSPRYDETILSQAVAYLEILKKGRTNFVPKHSEDYCFARAFNLVTKEEGEARWPSLRGQESNRLLKMEETLRDADLEKEITSVDHRIVQAIVMRQASQNKRVKIWHPEAVKKSWPQFWKFLAAAPRLSREL